MNCDFKKSIDIQGHRGCRGLMPENTIEAFDKAIDLGVHTLELDVVVSKDNIVVVSHEPFMNHEICLTPAGNEIDETKEKAYNLYQMTFDSIKQFDCGSKVHPKFPDQQKLETYKPTLDEVLKVSKSKNPEIKFNIELKAKPKYDDIYTPKPATFLTLVLNVLEKNNVLEQTNLQSFDLRILEEIKKQSPDMAVALLVEEDEIIQDKLSQLSYSPEIISPFYRILNSETVKNLQSENFKVIPWTVNEIDDLELMIAFEVDGIITDYPDRLIELLE